MSKPKQIELPPTWAEMQAGDVSAPKGEGWSTAELIEAWGKGNKAVLNAMKRQGWVCVGRRKERSIIGQIKDVPIYAPKS